MSPRRIMLVIHSMQGGGSERQLSLVANEFADRYETRLVTLGNTDSRYPLNHRVHRVGLDLVGQASGFLGGLLANKKRVDAIRRQIVESKSELVLSFCDTNNILTALAAHRIVPSILCERSDPRQQRLSPVWEWMRDRAYPRATTIVSQTESVTRYFQERYTSRVNSLLWKTIPSAIEIPELDHQSIAESRVASGQKRLLGIGRLAKEKRWDRVIRAWASMRAEFPDWKLRLVGSGPEENNLKGLAETLGVETTIEWAGWSDDVWHELKHAHVLCLSSEYEGFPQIMLEAMASGLPVVIRNCSDAIGQVIQSGKNGMIFQSESELVEQLRTLLGDSGRRAKLGEAAAIEAKRYGWEAIAPSWDALVEETIAFAKAGMK